MQDGIKGLGELDVPEVASNFGFIALIWGAVRIEACIGYGQSKALNERFVQSESFGIPVKQNPGTITGSKARERIPGELHGQ